MIPKTFALGIEDIVKPLATKARKFNVDLGDLFARYDTDKNNRLSAEELRNALAKNNLSLSPDDVNVLKEYFRNKYGAKAGFNNSAEITKEDFIKMMGTKFDRKYDQAEARKSLFDVRNKLEQLHITPQKLLMEYNSDTTELINISSFKIAIHSLKCLGQYDIDNLTKSCDTNNEGYISIGSFVAQVNNATMGSSFKSTKRSDANKSHSNNHSYKWSQNRQ